jgi:hypothetical protein
MAETAKTAETAMARAEDWQRQQSAEMTATSETARARMATADGNPRDLRY